MSDVVEQNGQKIYKSFVSAAKAYFGMKEGENLREFMNECSSLSPDDKAEMAEGMKRHGITIQSS